MRQCIEEDAIKVINDELMALRKAEEGVFGVKKSNLVAQFDEIIRQKVNFYLFSLFRVVSLFLKTTLTFIIMLLMLFSACNIINYSDRENNTTRIEKGESRKEGNSKGNIDSSTG